MTNDSLIDKLKFEVHHAAQDSDFDTGCNLAKEMAIEVVRHYMGDEPTRKDRARSCDVVLADDLSPSPTQPSEISVVTTESKGDL